MSHAQLSPSSAVRWMACPGSVALCKDLPDTSSSFADEGTDAHEVAALCLSLGTDAAGYVGTIREKGTIVGVEMALAVQDYVNYVRDVVKSTGGQLLVEQRLPISQITGEADAHGTADVVILAGDELIVADLKFGRGVPVEADSNPQLQIYALAALQEFGLVSDFTTVRMVIHQPRLGAVSEWTQTVEELEAFGVEVGRAAERTVGLAIGRTHLRAMYSPAGEYNPTEKGCKFCKAKATCPALARLVQDTVGSDFDDLTTFDRAATVRALGDQETTPADPLAAAMAAADLIEGWLKAVRAEVETRLLAGVPVPGWKVVQGKKGNRAWTDKAQAEALLRSMRVPHDQMYDYAVISPTSAEKLAKAEAIGPRQWPKVQALITQGEGRPSVAPESDKRPALVMSAVADDFQDVTADDLA
jgi:Protein of unknown function (DUF2800)